MSKPQQKKTNKEKTVADHTMCEDQKKALTIIAYLLHHCDDWLVKIYDNPNTHFENNMIWTLTTQFIRQWLNNGSDGHGLNDVEKVYKYLCGHKEFLCNFHMVNEKCFNLFGIPLWRDYQFDVGLPCDDEQIQDALEMAQRGETLDWLRIPKEVNASNA